MARVFKVTDRVLVTCPNMIGVMDDVGWLLEREGIDASIARATQQMSESDLLGMVGDYDGLIVGDDPITRAVLEAGQSGRLRAVAKWGVGVDNIDLRSAGQLGIVVTNTPDSFGSEVADVAMGYVILLARRLHSIDTRVRAGDWYKPQGISLAGRTMGVVGLGSVGSALAVRAQASEMVVIGSDPSPQAQQRAAQQNIRISDARSLATCDYLVLCCPLTEKTRHLVDESLLEHAHRLRIVNVARGALVDESALVRALERGAVHSAALDVLEHEPLAHDHPLATFPQVIFGSHNASNTEEASIRTSERAVANLIQSLRSHRKH